MINFVSKAAKCLLLGTIAACSIPAATVTYTLNNYTLSGGDSTYSVASDVTFNNLVLSETFADSVLVSVPLFNASNIAQTSLSTTTLDLTSAALSDTSAQHGALLSATITGSLSQTSLSILTSFGGTPSTVTVLPNFSATLPIAASTINVNALDSTGKAYAIGSLDAVKAASAAVPEPGTFAIAAIGMLALISVMRRFGKVAL